MRRHAQTRLLSLTAALCAAVAPVLAQDDPDSLPEGEGREDTFYTCATCHSFQLITRQGMSRAMWDDTIRLMVERHGMMEPDPEERERILTYLSEAYPPGQSGSTGRRGWTNPFQP